MSRCGPARRRAWALPAAIAVVLLGAGCGGSGHPTVQAVQIHPPHPAGEHADQCRRLVAALPAKVGGQSARPVQPHSPFVAAWGDPAIVLRCGVSKPAALRPTAECYVVNHVGWFAGFDGREADPTRPVTGPLTFTTIGRSTYVQVGVPAAYQPAADALADVAASITAATTWPHPCR